ncbi:uncharacterized protein LOC123529741 [Mercenaria mercenaria]|uniref:uncharacterized protein LOC123529741 n=1 Tax=Mercenaria mercenaria TaxID=6596 RepID=UPI00234E703D|nr:uncharacterized protein LOC123529741 [Mercenaria mercenaria]
MAESAGEAIEVPTKRIKFEDAEKLFFQNFLYRRENQRTLLSLRNNATEVARGLSDMTVTFLNVKTENACGSTSFTNATCEVASILEPADGGNKETIVLPLGALFKDGMQTILQFLNKNNPSIPQDVAKRRALKDLLTFLHISSGDLWLCEIPESGKRLTARLAQHLIAPLAPEKNILFNSTYINDIENCCDSVHPIYGEAGDTSFGCVDGWHGEVDILTADRSVAVSVLDEKDDEIPTTVSDSSLDNSLFMDRLRQQMLSETIVFSFLLFNETGGSLKNYLVPTVGISTEKLKIFFYDCVEDILLEACPTNLFYTAPSDRQIHTRAVLMLWLTLNYEIFCTGVPDVLKRNKSDFFRKIGHEVHERYRNNVSRNFHGKPKGSMNDVYTGGQNANHGILNEAELEKPTNKSITLF